MSGRPELIRFWIVMSSANITIPIVIIWSTHTGDLNRLGAVWSCWVCFIGLNALWLLALRSADRRVGRPGSGKRIIQAIALAFVAALLTMGYLNSYAPRNTYFALAMSNRPLNSIRPTRRRIVVKFIRERAAASRASDEAAAHMHPISPPLYSPESFANLDAMSRTVRQVQQAFDVDAAYARNLTQSYARFQEDMMHADPQYLQAWLSSPDNEETANQNIFAIEKEWVRSVQDLYGYAAQQHQKIRLRNGTLIFASAEIKNKFEDLENASTGLQQKMQTARAALLDKQHQAMARNSN